MDVTSYCERVNRELIEWKAKVEDIVKKLEKMPTNDDKAKIVPRVNELHALINEIDDSIAELKRECPTEWSPAKTELNGKITRITNIYEEVWPDVADADIGGAF
jgi:predicted nuclease with TOPRIM domain